MGQKERKKKEKRAATAGQAGGPLILDDARRWPILKCWMLNPDALRICGTTTGGLARAAPDGKIVSAGLFVDFRGPGIEHALVGVFPNPQELENFIHEGSRSLRARFHDADPAVLADVFYGALEQSVALKKFDRLKEVDGVQALLPEPVGHRGWRNRLVAHHKILSEGFLTYVEPLQRAELPVGKEVGITTTATFAVPDLVHLVTQIQNSPNFTASNDQSFEWSEPRPGAVSGRSTLGTVTLGDNSITIKAAAASYAARLADWLQEAVGPAAQLRSVHWEDPMGSRPPQSWTLRPAR
jgi:hypothetical protein